MPVPNDLFEQTSRSQSSYSAKDIEVLEGLEPVRRRPGMYIGGTDERALHHLAAEVLDNAMDEAVAGHANRIDVELGDDGALTVRDNGRGIPIDRHPKFKDKTALEVILTTLHSGGKFNNKVYHTSGGLHGVGISVVNALSVDLTIEVARDRALWRQAFARGAPTGKLKKVGSAPNRRGTQVKFLPDPEIFGPKTAFKPALLYRLARSKAYLFRGVEIRWKCPTDSITDDTPDEAVLSFPGGLEDYLTASLDGRACVTPTPFAGRVTLPKDRGRIEWAIAWPEHGEGAVGSYCNTVPTPQGGTHEAGMRAALTKGLKAYGDLVGNRRAAQITGDDVTSGISAMLSIFIPNPEFQGQTKERLATADATRVVDAALKDHFDHWLSGNPAAADALFGHVLERAEDRLRRRKEREVNRKSATRRLRLPGKLADCSQQTADGAELFLVEGDSAGGSAKQARDRRSQAVLPLRGKVLNVANASNQKIMANQELADLLQALGCGMGDRYREQDLRYDRVVIMTDADVDGAHIAALLMTFFFRQIPELINGGHLFLAIPPLYRLTQGAKTLYARDDAHKDTLMETEFTGRGKVEISRFKGLGEMLPKQLRETTMARETRTILRVEVDPDAMKPTADLVERLMGRKPEMRLAYIQDNARFVGDVDI